jgi:hypothetical protein
MYKDLFKIYKEFLQRKYKKTVIKDEYLNEQKDLNRLSAKKMHKWPTSTLLVIREMQIAIRIAVQNPPGQIVLKILNTKKSWWSGSKCRP